MRQIVDRDEAQSWFQAIADTAINASQGTTDLHGAAETITHQLAMLDGCLRRASDRETDDQS